MWQGLSEEICHLLIVVDLDQKHEVVLARDRLMYLVLADVNRLGALSSSNNVAPSFVARRVVIVYRRMRILRKSHVLDEVAEMKSDK
jgi:hypothetical protein